jgi:hypothetical protein
MVEQTDITFSHICPSTDKDRSVTRICGRSYKAITVRGGKKGNPKNLESHFPISEVLILYSMLRHTFWICLHQAWPKWNRQHSILAFGKTFADYVVETYISDHARYPPHLWASSPNMDTKRTNNGPETFHSHFNGQFYSAHPPMRFQICWRAISPFSYFWNCSMEKSVFSFSSLLIAATT